MMARFMLALVMSIPMVAGCSVVDSVAGLDQTGYKGDTPHVKLLSGKWATTDGKYRVVASASSNDGLSDVSAKLYEDQLNGKTLATTRLQQDEHGRWVGEMTFDAEAARLKIRAIDVHGDEASMGTSPIQPDDPTDRTYLVFSPDDLSSIVEDASPQLFGDLVIQTVPDLENLEGLRQLERVNGELTIAHNPELTTLEHLTSLEDIGSLTLEGNRRLTSLEGLSSARIYKDIRIHDTPALESIASLRLYKSIDGLFISEADKLTELTGFENLTEAGYFSVSGNDALSEISGFASLTSVEYLTINKNDSLESLDGLTGMNEVTGRIQIKKNATLDKCTIQTFVESLETRPDDYQMPSTTCR